MPDQKVYIIYASVIGQQCRKGKTIGIRSVVTGTGLRGRSDTRNWEFSGSDEIFYIFMKTDKIFLGLGGTMGQTNRRQKWHFLWCV